MDRLSKRFFLGSYLGGTIALWIIGCVAATLMSIDIDDKELPWVIVSITVPLALLGISVCVVQCMFIYKAWSSIQDGHVRTTPRKALGFMFIPLFNFYWIFQAVWGFAVDFNKYAARNNVNLVKRLPENLFLAYCILFVIGLIPYVNYLTCIASFVVACMLINKTCDAVNDLPPPNVNQTGGGSPALLEVNPT
jgi:hypothetical protein